MPGKRHALIIVLGLAVSGCQNVRHNDVLIFGTDTQLGLQIESAASNGGAPSINLGYEREEAVWMPLVENGPVPDPAVAGGEVAYQGVVQACFRAAEAWFSADFEAGMQAATRCEGLQRRRLYSAEGPTTEDGGRDTYSVFASFGARFNGSANASDVNAGAGLAQYFATGIAAQRLAANDNVYQALSTSAAGTAQADAAAAAATARADQAEQRMIAMAVSGEIEARPVITTEIDAIMACFGDGAWDVSRNNQRIEAVASGLGEGEETSLLGLFMNMPSAIAMRADLRTEAQGRALLTRERTTLCKEPE